MFLDGERAHPVRLRFAGSGLRLAIGGKEASFSGEALPDGAFSLRLDGRVFKARAVRDGSDWHVFSSGGYRRLTLEEALHGEELDARLGSLAAPMPGKVIQVLSRPGDAVKKGQALLILEAMKMEHTICAPADGVVKEVHFAPGEQVLEGAELITLE